MVFATYLIAAGTYLDSWEEFALGVHCLTARLSIYGSCSSSSRWCVGTMTKVCVPAAHVCVCVCAWRCVQQSMQIAKNSNEEHTHIERGRKTSMSCTWLDLTSHKQKPNQAAKLSQPLCPACLPPLAARSAWSQLPSFLAVVKLNYYAKSTMSICATKKGGRCSGWLRRGHGAKWVGCCKYDAFCGQKCI